MKHPALTNILIGITIIVTLIVTANPLALLGFFFLQAPSQLEMMDEHGAGDAIAEDTEYNEHGTGFNAKL